MKKMKSKYLFLVFLAFSFVSWYTPWLRTPYTYPPGDDPAFIILYAITTEETSSLSSHPYYYPPGLSLILVILHFFTDINYSTLLIHLPLITTFLFIPLGIYCFVKGMTKNIKIAFFCIFLWTISADPIWRMIRFGQNAEIIGLFLSILVFYVLLVHRKFILALLLLIMTFLIHIIASLVSYSVLFVFIFIIFFEYLQTRNNMQFLFFKKSFFILIISLIIIFKLWYFYYHLIKVSLTAAFHQYFSSMSIIPLLSSIFLLSLVFVNKKQRIILIFKKSIGIIAVSLAAISMGLPFFRSFIKDSIISILLNFLFNLSGYGSFLNKTLSILFLILFPLAIWDGLKFRKNGKIVLFCFLWLSILSLFMHLHLQPTPSRFLREFIFAQIIIIAVGFNYIFNYFRRNSHKLVSILLVLLLLITILSNAYPSFISKSLRTPKLVRIHDDEINAMNYIKLHSKPSDRILCTPLSWIWVKVLTRRDTIPLGFNKNINASDTNNLWYILNNPETEQAYNLAKKHNITYIYQGGRMPDVLYRWIHANETGLRKSKYFELVFTSSRVRIYKVKETIDN